MFLFLSIFYVALSCTIECGGPKPFQELQASEIKNQTYSFQRPIEKMVFLKNSRMVYVQDSWRSVWKLDLFSKKITYQGRETDLDLLPVEDPEGSLLFFGNPLVIWDLDRHTRKVVRELVDFTAVGVWQKRLYGFTQGEDQYRSWSVDLDGKITEHCRLPGPSVNRMASGHSFPFAYFYSVEGKSVLPVRWNLESCTVSRESAFENLTSPIDFLHVFDYINLLLLKPRNCSQMVVKKDEQCFLVPNRSDMTVLESIKPLAIGTEQNRTYLYNLERREKLSLPFYFQGAQLGIKADNELLVVPKEKKNTLIHALID